MGKALRITLGLRTFTSKKAAVEYFMGQRDAVSASGELTAGELFEELRELYSRYCDSSPEWALNGRDIIGFVVDHERRRNGATWAQHLCYKVCFSNREVRPFSIDKALSALSRSGVPSLPVQAATDER
ncbi:hypothetical protein [Serratia ureilytica]|uniref:hypothetical protein n=1 Tax=Serratia ureilytica TaxID=300181 RepID=UPI002361DA27|nr:hypothetical protein [Serratia ureilytica]